jgi:alpha-galactosidase
MCEGVDLLREACGDKLILGCGIPLGPCMGIFDACRIGCDVNKAFGGDWVNRLGLNNEVPSTQNALNNSVFRNHLDGRAFCNDPDVFFLRDNNLTFNLEQKLVLGKVNAVCGNVLFVSDNAGDYSEETLGYLKNFFTAKDYKVTGADYIDNETIRLAFTEDGKEKVLTFDIYTGASNINECM